jgi:hypothetical protein
VQGFRAEEGEYENILPDNWGHVAFRRSEWWTDQSSRTCRESVCDDVMTTSERMSRTEPGWVDRIDVDDDSGSAI